MELDLTLFHTYFENEAPFRQHKIICGDRSFFVNGGFLAEQSHYFEKLFYGDFKEAESKTLTISSDSNITEEDVLEYLSLVYGREEVSELNCVCAIRMGDLWDTPSVRAKCETFLESDFWESLTLDGTQLKFAVDVLEAALLHGFKTFVEGLVEFIGKHTLDMLKAERFVERIDEGGVIATVYTSAASGHTEHTWITIASQNLKFCHCGIRGTFACSNPGCIYYLCAIHRHSTVTYCAYKPGGPK